MVLVIHLCQVAGGPLPLEDLMPDALPELLAGEDLDEPHLARPGARKVPQQAQQSASEGTIRTCLAVRPFCCGSPGRQLRRGGGR